MSEKEPKTAANAKLTMHELGRLTPEEFRQQPKTPIIIVYDNVRSALNVGSAFRTADSFRLEGIYLCGITAQPPHKEIFKTALGATETVTWQYFEQTTEALHRLRESGYTLLAIEQVQNRIWLHDFEVKPEAKYAIVFGNEVEGVSNEAIELCHHCIEIPQIGAKHSLNISVCTGIVVWEFVRNYFK